MLQDLLQHVIRDGSSLDGLPLSIINLDSILARTSTKSCFLQCLTSDLPLFVLLHVRIGPLLLCHEPIGYHLGLSFEGGILLSSVELCLQPTNLMRIRLGRRG